MRDSQFPSVLVEEDESQHSVKGTLRSHQCREHTSGPVAICCVCEKKMLVIFLGGPERCPAFPNQAEHGTIRQRWILKALCVYFKVIESIFCDSVEGQHTNRNSVRILK